MDPSASAEIAAKRRLCILGGLAGIAGVAMIGTSFAINAGPPPDSPASALARYAQAHEPGVVWGAWLQAVGPWLVVSFALTLVHLAGAAARLAGWMTLLGASLLMLVSLSEVTIYLSALAPEPADMAQISANLGHGMQHLYYFVAAPALFLPLGAVVLSSRILPRLLGWLAILLGLAFFLLGVTSLHDVVLPDRITAFAAIQSLWWLLAAITVLVRSRNIAAGAP